MKILIYQIDAFTSEVFRGNPAAVCPLDGWIAPETMQAIAAENNLSETAFFVRMSDRYSLRWFTPRHEVQLCGHATLASAYVIFHFLDRGVKAVTFETCSGSLIVLRESEWLAMDFPALPVKEVKPPRALLEGIGPKPKLVVQSFTDAPEGNYFAIYESEDDVRNVRPNFAKLEELHPSGLGITAPGHDCDFVSRYFAPSYGIPEDPVTGSIHCSLGPYWAERLKKTSLCARQLSARGGELIVEPRGERVTIKGQAVMYMEGSIAV